MESEFEKKRTRLFVILSGIFITNALLAEIIGVKIFSGETTIGVAPAQIGILGFKMDFNLTAGVLIWPVVFITTDLINEYFGKPGVKRISYLTAVLIAYAFLIIFMAIELPPAPWWGNLQNEDGSTYNMDQAFSRILGQGQRIIIGSLTAFIVGQLVDVFVFQKLRSTTGGKRLWLRATGSTLVSQLVDSFVVLFIAFYGVFPTQQIFAIAITNYIYKFTIAILLTPLVYLGHSIIDNYLGKEHAHRISEEAAQQSKGFL
ncbi:queuosine precursor transporter [Chryseosolibacter indicus]|uniref:Probable queuosine precursor transporter n=1 Tax=Chryseosolibacter indicus TaxID=2782351 RepID=A0ABS5VS98_9BACT|nr:queuosine precursor transporter [Chryseosolibacter indicus]MBT1703715.1 queuosine precursor transporter [Chryseosolibacter indicus]